MWCKSVVNRILLSSGLPPDVPAPAHLCALLPGSGVRSAFCWARIPFGQSPSLRLLRSPTVRHSFGGFTGTTELSEFPGARSSSALSPADFPTRPAAPSQPRARHTILPVLVPEVFPCVHGVSDRAGPVGHLAISHAADAAFRHTRQRRHPGLQTLSRLNTRPARCPCQRFALRPHGRRRMTRGQSWVATPSTV